MSQQTNTTTATDKAVALAAAFASVVTLGFLTWTEWHETQLRARGEKATLQVNGFRIENPLPLFPVPVPIKTYIEGTTSALTNHYCSGGLVSYSYGRPAQIEAGKSYPVKIHGLGGLYGDRDHCGVIFD